MRIAWAAPLALALLVALPGNGAERPLETHEVYVARTAEEMLQSGSWLRPTFNGELRLEKPPLSYWLAIAAHRALTPGPGTRVTPFEARLPSVAAALGLVLVVYWLGSSLSGDRRVGAVAATLTATSAGFVSYAHNARPEMLYALGCTIEVLGWCWSRRRLAERRSSTVAAAALAWGGFALALLAKGPLLPTFLLIGLVIGWRLERPRLSLLRTLRPGIGLLVVGSVALAVFGGLARAEPTAFGFWWDEMFHHGGGRSLAWYLPLEGYYAYAPLPLLLPWIALVPLGAREAWRAERTGARPLGIALLASALCLSFSPTRHAYYLLPALPLALVLMAQSAVGWFDAARSDPRALRRLQRALAVHLALLAVLALAAPLAAVSPGANGPELVAGFGALAALAAIGAGSLLRPRTPRALAALGSALAVLVAGVFGLASWSGLGWSADRYAEARFARQVALVVPRDEPLVSVGQTAELVVYFGDRLVERVAKDDLAAVLAAEPGTHVLAFRQDLPELGLGPPIIASGPEEDARVLVAPRCSDTPGPLVNAP